METTKSPAAMASMKMSSIASVLSGVADPHGAPAPATPLDKAGDGAGIRRSLQRAQASALARR